jgi:ABC-type lipoprotein release transport system permease subunit
VIEISAVLLAALLPAERAARLNLATALQYE